MGLAVNFLECLITGWRIFRALRKMGGNSLVYFACAHYGVPTTIVLIGQGQEAWRVADFAANYHLGRS